MRSTPAGLPKIYGVGHGIVLITDIALQNTEIDERCFFTVASSVASGAAVR